MLRCVYWGQPHKLQFDEFPRRLFVAAASGNPLERLIPGIRKY